MSQEIKYIKAFTAVELIIALAFISSLLLVIALTVLQMSNLYNRGLTIKAVSQAGTTVSDNLKDSIQAAMPFSVATDSQMYIRNDDGGRLCLNNYSYIWNYGKSLNSKIDTPNKYTPESSNKIRLVKVRDPGGTYCVSPSSPVSTTDAIDLLASGDRNLAVHSFSIISESTAYDKLTLSRLYTINLRIGTNNPENLLEDYTKCKEPGQIGSDLSYCYVEVFTFAVMSGNKYER